MWQKMWHLNVCLFERILCGKKNWHFIFKDAVILEVKVKFGKMLEFSSFENAHLQKIVHTDLGRLIYNLSKFIVLVTSVI